MLRKLGELRSENYEINWEEWENDNGDLAALESTVESGILDYEQRFLEMISASDDDMDDDKLSEAEEIVDTLIQGYVMHNLFSKKRAIEDFISSI
jgi:hypothetical protein